MNYYLEALRKYAVFSGRAGRKEYWMYVLVHAAILIILYIVGLVIDTQALYYLYAFATLVPGVAAATRRLHDTGRSGWWQLIGLVPLVGAIIFIVFAAQKSMAGPNKYGPSSADMAPAVATAAPA